ncbi:MAG: hypothetical protein O7D86_01940 [Proteobacteria bacterium]|nr:hypothetical protein [Pseudomonadota bacterium]
MTTLDKIEIRCLNCHIWFKSPISFRDIDTLDTATLSDNIVVCPHCGKETGCNKENIRATGKDAGFVGNDTV